MLPRGQLEGERVNCKARIDGAKNESHLSGNSIDRDSDLRLSHSSLHHGSSPFLDGAGAWIGVVVRSLGHRARVAT